MLEFLSDSSIDFILLEMSSGSASQALLCKFQYTGFLCSGEQLINIEKVEKDNFGDYLFIIPKSFKSFQ